jgi:hypothetical protein
VVSLRRRSPRASPFRRSSTSRRRASGSGWLLWWREMKNPQPAGSPSGGRYELAPSAAAPTCSDSSPMSGSVHRHPSRDGCR